MFEDMIRMREEIREEMLEMQAANQEALIAQINQRVRSRLREMADFEKMSNLFPSKYITIIFYFIFWNLKFI